MSKSKMMKIMVGGREYPCRATMGAMLRFKRETGREVTELDMSQMSDLAVWLWCCVLSACAADGVDFGMGLMEFADQLSPDVMTAWVAGEASDESARNRSDGPDGDDGEKKT